MQTALASFQRNIDRARVLGGLHQTLSAKLAPAIDTTDLLRAELVLAVSAFDHLIHELTRIGMLETLQGKRQSTPAFAKFATSMGATLQALADPSKHDWLDTEIRDSHGWKSFQQPDKVADAIRLISTIKLWDSVAAKLGQSAADIKTRLELIVDRRNKIAHEADLDPTDPTLTTQWPIGPQYIEDAVQFLGQVGTEVYNLVK